MNQIAKQLKEKNIAEYLIYMWQEEDLIRANHGELEEIEANVIARYPEDQRPAPSFRKTTFSFASSFTVSNAVSKPSL